MKNGRLFELLYLLVERRALTAGELAERFEVSERTIYRDVDALSAAGVPVYTQRGQGGGIRLMDQFVLDRCLLSPREQDEVLFALRALLSTGGLEGAEALERLSALFRREAEGWVEVDFTDWGSGEQERENFRIVREGILGRRLLDGVQDLPRSQAVRAMLHRLFLTQGEDVLLPRCMLILGEALVEQIQHPLGGAHDVVVSEDVLVDLRAVDVDVDDFGVGCEGGGVGGHPVGEAAADGDEQIALVGGEIGGVGAVHTDHAGHKHKWMSPEYIKSIEEADVEIGKFLEKMKRDGLYKDTHFMFLTDHGGIEYGHGGVSTNEMIVPWGITGPGIRKGFKITEPNNTVNTAATILRLFDVEKPLPWTGEVLSSIFK